MAPFRGAALQDEPFIATGKALLKRLNDKRRDLEGGQWDGEVAALTLVAEIRLLKEILGEMRDLSNINFGEEDL